MVTKLFMRNIVRRMTARYTTQQMTDTSVDSYLNLAYTIHMPLDFRNIKLNKPFTFTTVPNVDTYDFVYQNGLTTTPSGEPINGNIQIAPPVYCQGYQLMYFQDKQTFYNRWPKLSVNQQINMGGGVIQAYTGFIPSTPFLRAQLDIFGNVTEPAVIISAQNDTGYTYVLTDVPTVASNTGNLIDEDENVVGNVNYLSGAYSFTPANSTIIPANTVINASVVPYQASRPTDMFFGNNQIVLRPVPLDVYQVEIQVSQTPLDLDADTDQPQLDEWYLFICAWAAKLIYTDFPDPEGMAILEPTWQEQVQKAQRRTLRQMGSQRAATIFSQPGRPGASYFLGNEYSGSF